MNKEELDYNYDEVIEYCKGTAVQDSFEILDTDLNKLSEILDRLQESLHCGLSTCPAFLQIYDGFSRTLGCFDGSSGEGVALLMAFSAEIFNTCYAEAMTDKERLENEDYKPIIPTPTGELIRMAQERNKKDPHNNPSPSSPSKPSTPSTPAAPAEPTPTPAPVQPAPSTPAPEEPTEPTPETPVEEQPTEEVVDEQKEEIIEVFDFTDIPSIKVPDFDRTIIVNPDRIGDQNFIYDQVDGQYFDLYVPPTIEKDKPLIVYLPGIGGYGNESNLRSDGGGGFFTEIDQNGMSFNSYVLTPQYPARGSYNVDDIMKCVNSTIEKYGIDPNRVSIMGYSQGAEVLPKVVEAYPNSFNSAVFVAKGYGISNPEVFKDIPVYGLYGDSDSYANSQTPSVITQLQNAGVEAYVKEYSSQGHAYMPNRILEDTNLADGYGNIVDWMLAQ